MKTIPEINASELSILCWLDWFDGPLSGLISWKDDIFWFQYYTRWGVDEENDIWEEDWGYCYEVYSLSDVQLHHATDWFKRKGAFFKNIKTSKIPVPKWRHWEGPVLENSPVATFTDREPIEGYDLNNYSLPEDFHFTRPSQYSSEQLAITEEQVLGLLKSIENEDILLTPDKNPQEYLKGDIVFTSSNGWTIEVSNWSGSFAGIVELISPTGVVLDSDFIELHLPKVHSYFPDEAVAQKAYKMKSQ